MDKKASVRWTRRKRVADPFAQVLNQAADRLFLKPVWLGDDLKRDPAGTPLYGALVW
jgi:hypothetical protein